MDVFCLNFVQFVSEIVFPNLYWDFNGWACNPVPGPQDAHRRFAMIVTSLSPVWALVFDCVITYNPLYNTLHTLTDSPLTIPASRF